MRFLFGFSLGFAPGYSPGSALIGSAFGSRDLLHGTRGRLVVRLVMELRLVAFRCFVLLLRFDVLQCVVMLLQTVML